MEGFLRAPLAPHHDACLITEYSYGGSVLIPTHPVNIPCGRKLEHPEKAQAKKNMWVSGFFL
jgi:hypothetical protein